MRVRVQTSWGVSGVDRNSSVVEFVEVRPVGSNWRSRPGRVELNSPGTLRGGLTGRFRRRTVVRLHQAAGLVKRRDYLVHLTEPDGERTPLDGPAIRPEHEADVRAAVIRFEADPELRVFATSATGEDCGQRNPIVLGWGGGARADLDG